MKSKVIALMLLIPILLMFTMFQTANTYSLLVDVSVGDVALEVQQANCLVIGEKHIRADISNSQNTINVKPKIMPVNSTNQAYTYSQLQYLDYPLGKVDIAENGNVTLMEVGFVDLIVRTNDGGFSDNVILEIVANKPTTVDVVLEGFEPVDGVFNVPLSEGVVNYSVSTNVTTGTDYLLDTAIEWNNGIGWSKLDNCPYVQYGDNIGQLRVKNVGNVKMRATLNDDVTDTIVQSEFELCINNDVVDKYVLDSRINGDNTITAYEESVSFDIHINKDQWVSHYGKALDQSAISNCVTYDNSLIEVQSTVDVDTYVATFTVLNVHDESGKYEVAIDLFDEDIVVKVDFKVSVNEDNFVWKYNSNTIEDTNDEGVAVFDTAINDISLQLFKDGSFATSDPVFMSSDDNIIEVLKSNGNTVSISPKAEGTAVITAKITVRRPVKQGGNYDIVKQLQINCYQVPTYLAVKGNNNKYGMVDKLTVGGYDFDKDYGYINHQLQLKTDTDAKAGDILWSSSNNKIASIDSKGLVTINGTGVATFTATSNNANAIGKPMYSTISINFVGQGVNVSTYAQLLKATDDNTHAVVLTNSIGSYDDSVIDSSVQPFYTTSSEITKLALKNKYNWYSFDQTSSSTRQKVIAYTTQRATSDLMYNFNAGKDGIDTRDNVNVGITFSKDVHGNGYYLNSHELTVLRKDSTGASVKLYTNYSGQPNCQVPFGDTVPFVSATVGEKYTVYGQDNISFFVKGENIAISNIQLQSLNNGIEDLSLLDHSGTTVEAEGKNITIDKCRLKLGRTVLRIFSGDANDETNDSTTSVVVSNSILGQSREFTVRIGANKMIRHPEGTHGINYGPAINGLINPTRFGEAKQPNVDSYNNQLVNNADYCKQVIRTYVTMRDCVLEKSGLLSIAMDTHFAGHYLNDKGASMGSSHGWDNCAGTSYGAKLTLEGQVRFYDWKKVDSINSGSLVGLVSETNPDPFGMTALIKRYDPQYQLIFRRQELVEGATTEVEYAHGGIAFFGGGRNYSLIDNGTTTDKYRLNDVGVVVGLGDVNVTGGSFLAGYLEGCAGGDKFRFYMQGAESQFDVTQQEEDYRQGVAYNWMLQ